MVEWLIVGLGNPGSEYERTRHNLGFMLIDLLGTESGTSVRRTECRSLIGRALIEGKRADLVKPQTYMNLSGEAVKCLLEKREERGGSLMVISDDLALPFGTIRLRPKGSHGGHNGLRSIIEKVGTTEFARLRIGIAPGHPIADPKKFVLQSFGRAEGDELARILKRSAEAIRSVIRDGIDRAMANFN